MTQLSASLERLRQAAMVDRNARRPYEVALRRAHPKPKRPRTKPKQPCGVQELFRQTYRFVRSGGSWLTYAGRADVMGAARQACARMYSPIFSWTYDPETERGIACFQDMYRKRAKALAASNQSWSVIWGKRPCHNRLNRMIVTSTPNGVDQSGRNSLRMAREAADGLPMVPSFDEYFPRPTPRPPPHPNRGNPKPWEPRKPFGKGRRS